MSFSLLITKENWFPCHAIKIQGAGVYFRMEPIYGTDDLDYWDYAASSEITIHQIKNHGLFFLLKQIKEARYLYVLTSKREDRQEIVHILKTTLPIDRTVFDEVSDTIFLKGGEFVQIYNTEMEESHLHFETNSRRISGVKSQHIRHWINLDSNFFYEEKI